MFCLPGTVLSSGDPILDDPDVARELPPRGGDGCTRRPFSGRGAVKDGSCHWRDCTVEAVFLSLATWGKSKGVLKGLIAVCHRTSYLILTRR